ncbi:pro-resilin-like [Aricia agestis]|uniref:pro-resilin-like n=1 Tax=Aricia agestis TaxID=91739 RepID=UPI001C20978B|nr:pro-resilin-like [Aricia agestis]
MKIAVCLVLVAYALAEPPVDNRYLPPQAGYSERLAASPDYRAPEYGNRQGAPGRRPSTSYGAPRPQNNYLPPNRRQRPTSSYLPPSSQRPNRPAPEYGPPSRPSNFAPRPATEYGAPAQYDRPAQEYGPPEFGRASPDITTAEFGQSQTRQYLPPGRGRGTGAGVEYDDGSNGEPANYSFEYMVKDEESGNDFGHRESRQGDRAEGLYYVLLPDGRKQTVEYEADQDGYRPRVSYEDTGVRTDSRNGGRGRGYEQYTSGGY